MDNNIVNWFRHKYPYSNLHELNLDWILTRMQELEDKFEGLEAKILSTVMAQVTEYVEGELNTMRAEMDVFRGEMDDMKTYFNNAIATLNGQYEDFIANVDSRIQELEDRIDAVYGYIDAGLDRVTRETETKISACDSRTDQKIDAIATELREEIAEGVAGLKVLNYFTGQLIPIQDMINILASLHTEDAITYGELATAEITYQQYTDLHMTYYELAMKGKSFVDSLT